MERQDLQFYRQINLTHVHSVCYIENQWREVEDAGHTRRYETVTDGLCRAGRGGYHADRHLVPHHDVLEVVGVPDRQPPDPGTDDGRIGIQQGRDAETAGREATVVGQRAAEVTGADDDDGPVLG